MITNTMKRTALIAVVLTSLASARAAAIELLTNGNFETGTFAGWTVTDQAGGSGSFFVDTPGTTTPLSGILTTGSPANGSFYAVSDQTGPGAHTLLQSFTVPIGATSVILSFDMFVNDSDGGPIIHPDGLDFAVIVPNQHARVDLLTGVAGAFDTGAGVVSNHYLGVDPQASNPNPFTSYLIDITAFVAPGGTYQVRFGEVDNQSFLNQGVDNVSIVANVGVPDGGSTALLLGMATVVGVFASRRQKSTR
jgi:hypothetical protein